MAREVPGTDDLEIVTQEMDQEPVTRGLGQMRFGGGRAVVTTSAGLSSGRGSSRGVRGALQAPWKILVSRCSLV